MQVFAELDEKVQDQFNNYLAERGVTNELGTYLLVMTEDKEQREYMRWLNNVTAFVKQ